MVIIFWLMKLYTVVHTSGVTPVAFVMFLVLGFVMFSFGFMFMFMHLADAYIQSNLQVGMKGKGVLSKDPYWR